MNNLENLYDALAVVLMNTGLYSAGKDSPIGYSEDWGELAIPLQNKKIPFLCAAVMNCQINTPDSVIYSLVVEYTPDSAIYSLAVEYTPDSAIYSLAIEIYTPDSTIYSLQSPLQGVYAIYDRMWRL